MPDNILIELTCPSCAHLITLQEEREPIACPACSSQLLLDEQMGEVHCCQDKEQADSERRMAQWQQDRQLIATAVVVLSIFIILVAAFAVL
jgi:DNA-directed RNA polymerase subunit RPC12/RpoP